MAPIGVGIIGLSADKSAWATSAHSAPLKSAPLNEKFKLVAVGTSSPETAKKAADAHGVDKEKAYSNPEAMANDEAVDLVVVSVKTPLHKQLALPALHAKKSVFVEWPLASSLQDAEELAALAKKQGVKTTAVGLQMRLLPAVQKAKSIIDSGALGRITGTSLITSNSILEKMTVKNSYINDPESGASIVSIPAIHALDPICYLLGEFTSLSATTATAFPELRFVQADGSKGEPVKSNIADFVSVSGVLESGATASFTMALTTAATPTRYEWIISGEKGSLKFEAQGPFMAVAPHQLYQCAPLRKQEGGGNEGGSPYQAKDGVQWEEVEFERGAFGGIGEVYAAIADGNKDLVDFDEAVKRHKMVEAILRSAKNGTRERY